MKIAFLILAHTDVDQLKRLCVKLVDYGNLYIHIDKRTNKEYLSQINDYISSKELCHNVKIINNRVNVTWGGFSQVRAIKLLLEAALEENEPRFDRLFVISGLCYPLYSPSELISYSEANKNKEMLAAYNLSQGINKEQKQRIELYHFFRDINLPHKSFLRKSIIGGTKLLLKYLHFRKKPYILIDGIRWDVYKSAEWVGLTRECSKYVLNQLNQKKELVSYFKTSYASDELVVATIVMNSEYRNRAFHIDSYELDKLSMLHFLHYTDHIWTYDENDFEALIKSGKPFVRKLVSGKSEKLIEMINNLHEQKTHTV